MRPPPRTFAAICSMHHQIKSHCPIAAAQHADFGGVAIEQLEAGALLGAKIVLDIIAQVPRAEVAVLRRVAEILPRDGVALLHARFARLLQRADILGAQHARSAPPRTPRRTEGRSSRSTPRRDRSSGSTLGRRLRRAVAGPSAGSHTNALSPMMSAASRPIEHGVQIGAVRLDGRLDLEQPRAQHANERHRRPRARVHHDRPHVRASGAW